MRIADRFSELASRGERALVPFVTAGDPSLEELPAILDALMEGGADLIELGLPFSDPIADGPVIQASSQRALDRGVTPSAALDALSRCTVGVPVVAMGYYNPLLRHGLERAARAMAEAGVSGAIVSDLTPEESDGWVAAARAAWLETVFLAAPTSTDVRLEQVCGRASGFVYAVSRTGVTGAGVAVPPDVKTLVARLKQRTSLPVCVGFGISKPEHVRMVCEVADGAVVGSWLVDLLAREWKGGAGRSLVIDSLARLKEATRG